MRAPFTPSSARSLLAALALLRLEAGCQSASDRRLIDTEGREFAARCERSGECTLKQTGGVARSDRKTALTLSRTGRLVGVCDVTPGQAASTPVDCRALVCQADSDCPPSHGLKDGQCLDAWCSDAAQALTSTDSVMLCLAGMGLGRDQPGQVDRYALGLNCGSPCKVPAPCRQP